jgi:hypothetical protein
MIPCRRSADGDALPDEVSVSIAQRAPPRAYSWLGLMGLTRGAPPGACDAQLPVDKRA